MVLGRVELEKARPTRTVDWTYGGAIHHYTWNTSGAGSAVWALSVERQESLSALHEITGGEGRG